jgi:hypothetical protein
MLNGCLMLKRSAYGKDEEVSCTIDSFVYMKMNFNIEQYFV